MKKKEKTLLNETLDQTGSLDDSAMQVNQDVSLETSDFEQSKPTLNAKKKNINYMRRNQVVFCWLMLAIPILSWIIWWFAAKIGTIVQAFIDPITNQFSFINFVDFWESLTGVDESLGSLKVSLKNTFGYFFLHFFIEFPIDVVITYFIYKKIRGHKIFRFIFYFPAIISGVIMTGVFKELVSARGPLGDLCNAVGWTLPQGGLLGNVETATKTIMVYDFWTGLCASMLVIGGSMARIPVEVLESARIDGVGAGRELVNLVVPLIWPSLSTMLLVGLTQILSASGPILLLAPSMTLGTSTISYWIFDKVYAGGVYMAGKYNLASATGLAFSLVVVPFTLIMRKVMELVPAVEY